MMSPERWREIKVLFETAVELPDSDLESFLRAECGADAGLYAAVRRMLDEDRRSGLLDYQLLAAPAPDPVYQVHEAELPVAENGSETAGVPALIAGRYERLELVGAGGMGEVYRARDWLTGDLVALKRIRGSASRPWSAASTGSHTVPGSQRGAAFEMASKRVALAREFRVLASLRHPNIIPVLDYGFAAEGYPFFTMTLLEEAQTLTGAADAETMEGKVQLLFQVLRALCYLHRHGIVHRDLKPSNILVAKGQVTVVDFGISRPSGRGAAGTPIYMAPEMWSGERPTTASDLYSFGIVAIETLSGRRIRIPDPDSLDQPASVRSIIGRLLEGRPADRYRDAETVLFDWAAATGHPQPADNAGHRESYLQAAPLVGRRAELSHLTRSMRAAAAGKGSCVLLGGEGGVGKTRLIEELKSRAMVRGALALSGRVEEFRAAPYSAFKSAALRLALLLPLENGEAAVLKTVFPDIEKVLRRQIPDMPACDPQVLAERLASTIAGLFRRYGKPALFVLEDCHHIEEELPILRRLGAVARDLPLLIVASYRSEERPDLPAEFPEAAVMQVNRLNPPEIRAMSVAMLGEQLGGNDTLVKFLTRETEGNAFFLVEAVRALAEERGSLSAVTPEALPGVVFARGIHDAVQRRLRNAPLWARGYLHLAAIVGREVNPAVLADAGVGADLDAFLQLCDRQAILEGHGYVWRFVHEKLREGLLREVDPTERADLHRRVAVAIENRFGDHPDWVQALAFHWRNAGIVEKSTLYAVKAAGRSLSLGLPEKAVEVLLEGLSALGERIPADAASLGASIGGEDACVRALLAQRPFEELVDLPTLTDERIERLVRMLKMVQPAAHISQRPELFALSALRCMALTLEYGVGPWAPEVFATYAAVLRGMTADSRTAYKYIQIADHYDRQALGRLSGPVAFLDAWFIRHWLYPVKDNLLLASEGAASAAAAGDILYQAFCASSYVMYLAASGAALGRVVEEAGRQMQVISGGVLVAQFHCLLERQFAQALSGGTAGRLSLTDATCDEQRDLASICATNNRNQIPYYYLARMRLHYYYGEYAAALEYSARALPLLPAFRGQIGEWMFAFYRGLSLLGLALASPVIERNAWEDEARPLKTQMEAWAADNPSGFAHQSDLLQAEWARLDGNPRAAVTFYAKAASGAEALGAIHDVALARERAADFFLASGEPARARAELRAAMEAYSLWGAEAKVSWLKERWSLGTELR